MFAKLIFCVTDHGNEKDDRMALNSVSNAILDQITCEAVEDQLNRSGIEDRKGNHVVKSMKKEHVTKLIIKSLKTSLEVNSNIRNILLHYPKDINLFILNKISSFIRMQYYKMNILACKIRINKVYNNLDQSVIL